MCHLALVTWLPPGLAVDGGTDGSLFLPYDKGLRPKTTSSGGGGDTGLRPKTTSRSDQDVDKGLTTPLLVYLF